MIRSQIVEASSFTQQRVEFNIPQKLATSIKIAHLGVFGGNGYVVNGIIGMAHVISKIVLRDGATVLSQYDQNVNNYLEFKLLQQNNSRHRNINKVLYGSNFGFVSENAGLVGANVSLPAVASEQVVNPRVCLDKHDLKKSATLEANSDLAVVNLADMLGFCRAVFSDGQQQVSGFIPCHVFSNLKLSIEFNTAVNTATNATTVAQPYLIFDEIIDPQMEAMLAKPSIVAQYSDLELEKIFLGAAANSKAYLNSFYGKTVGSLFMMVDDGGQFALSQLQETEVVRLNVNNTPLFQLTTGIDSASKKAAFLRMLGVDLSIPLMSDRFLDIVPAPNQPSDVTSIYEGLANCPNTETNFYSSGTCSYLALPVNTRITQLQLDYSRTSNQAISLLFWGEVVKVGQFISGAYNVSYM